jgi:hypothetical protein
MRTALVLVFVIATQTLFAQTGSRSFKNEIGMMGDVALGEGSYRTNGAGIHYKHWRNKHVGYRFVLGAGALAIEGAKRYYSLGNPDTFYSNSDHFRLPMTFIGGGIEAQKQLYKKLIIYLGAEVRFGFGQGHEDVERVKYYAEPSAPNNYLQSHTEIIAGRSYSDYWIGFSPLVGLKLNLKRFVIGTEFSDPVNFVARKTATGSLGDLDFNFLRLNERFYISYRF